MAEGMELCKKKCFNNKEHEMIVHGPKQTEVLSGH